MTIDDITYLTCRGGWPWATLISKEVKLGGKDLIDEGAANMLKLSQRIDTDKMPSPSFMAVIIEVGNYAYQREDGVYVFLSDVLKIKTIKSLSVQWCKIGSFYKSTLKIHAAFQRKHFTRQP